MEEERTQLEETLDTGTQEAPQETVEEKDIEQEAPKKPNDINIRQLREAKEQVQKERDEYLRRLQEIEEAKQKSQPVEEEFNLNPDDLVEWRHVDKKIKKLEQQLNQYQQQSNLSSTETALKAKFNDFDQVVTSENVELLRTLEPELADSIHSNPNLYNKAVAAYKAIKRLVNDQGDYNEKERAIKNMQKPKPSNSASPQTSDSPLTKAGAFGRRMNDERRKEVYEEMQRILGRR